MIAKTFRVTVLGAERADELARLRRRCYRASTSFSWFDESVLEWTPVDASSVVIGSLDGDGALVATVRASCRPDRAAVEALLGYSTERVPPRHPALVGGRSATDAQHARQGLAAAMRWVIVRQALRLDMASITGVVYDDAPRVRSMQAQGYEFYEAPRQWDAEARLRAKPIVISMPAPAYRDALRLIEAQAADALAACAFDDAVFDAAFDADARRWLGAQRRPAAAHVHPEGAA